MTDDSQPMKDVRGAIILCDYVGRLDTGKWLIAGTYDSMLVHQAECPFHAGLNLYLRCQLESQGKYPFRLKLIQRDLPPTVDPLMEMHGEIEVKDARGTIETGFRTPPFTVHFPGDFSRLAPDQAIAINLLIWANVGGHVLANSPFRIIFSQPGTHYGLPSHHDPESDS